MAEYGKNCIEEFKTLIHRLLKLKNDLQGNGPLKSFTSNKTDLRIYNDYLVKCNALNGNTTFFNATLLHTETYVYRKIYDICTDVVHDPFRFKKQESFFKNIELFEAFAIYYQEKFGGNEGNTKEKFIDLLKVNLWNSEFNKLNVNESYDSFSNYIDLLHLTNNIVCDHSEKIWYLASNELCKSQTIDIILDNAGFDLFSDLFLADFIITNCMAKKIRFYVKQIPWFVTKVTSADFFWFVLQIKNNSLEVLQALGDRWFEFMANDEWKVEEHAFWTYPFTYDCMEKVDPGLYAKLGESKLVMFKGDLDYRKLFGEKNWDPTTPLSEALRGFSPSNVCISRLFRSEVSCGLNKTLVDRLDASEFMWMFNGRYGVIQCVNNFQD